VKSDLPRRPPHGGIAAALFLGLALSAGATAAAAQTTFPVDQLMAPGPLPDIAQGSADAPVTIIEYGSLTCSHCAEFQHTTWPALKAKYVDAGKVRYIVREYPRDPLDTAAFMSARCAGPDKRNAIVDLLWAQQKNWAFGDTPVESLAAALKQAGVSQADFEACLKNQDLLTKMNQARVRANEAFKVESTPTFFVNGQLLSGEQPIEEFDKAIQPLLK
jgi:protein-disulfide isomerase